MTDEERRAFFAYKFHKRNYGETDRMILKVTAIFIVCAVILMYAAHYFFTTDLPRLLDWIQ